MFPHQAENTMIAFCTRATILIVVLAAGALFVVRTSSDSAAQPPLAGGAQPKAVVPAPLALTPESASVLTEAVGLLAGLQLYQTYLNIGMLADIRAEGFYEAATLAQLLGSVVTPLEQVDKQLEKIAALKGLGKDDAAALTRMRKIVGLLQTQGKSLKALWDTGVEDHAKKYEDARQAAWKEIDDLLDLNPKTGVAPAPAEPKKKP